MTSEQINFSIRRPERPVSNSMVFVKTTPSCPPPKKKSPTSTLSTVIIAAHASHGYVHWHHLIYNYLITIQLRRFGWSSSATGPWMDQTSAKDPIPGQGSLESRSCQVPCWLLFPPSYVCLIVQSILNTDLHLAVLLAWQVSNVA